MLCGQTHPINERSRQGTSIVQAFLESPIEFIFMAVLLGLGIFAFYQTTCEICHNLRDLYKRLDKEARRLTHGKI